MKPYSLDLRDRIHNYSLTHTVRETGKVFSVSPDTVNLLRKLFIETGSLNPRERSSEYTYLITSAGETYLQFLLAEKVDLTLEELCNRYENAFGIRVSIGTMYNTLERLNITRKKRLFLILKKAQMKLRQKKKFMINNSKQLSQKNDFT
jgi:transposase